MIEIDCPWCGRRSREEFTYGGDATVTRPDEKAGLAAWMNYVYLRDNRQGRHAEYWHHSLGCRRWFRTVRDNITNEIVETGAPARDPVAGKRGGG